MTYETMDWDAEAKRVAKAFGVDEEYRFVETPSGEMNILQPSTKGKYGVRVSEGCV